MTFAQTTFELPKYGASKRDAAISVASDPAPARKTTTPSPRRGRGPLGEVGTRTSALRSCISSDRDKTRQMITCGRSRTPALPSTNAPERLRYSVQQIGLRTANFSGRNLSVRKPNGSARFIHQHRLAAQQ